MVKSILHNIEEANCFLTFQPCYQADNHSIILFNIAQDIKVKFFKTLRFVVQKCL